MADQLILKRSELAHAGFEDYDVLCEGKLRCVRVRSPQRPRYSARQLEITVHAHNQALH